MKKLFTSKKLLIISCIILALLIAGCVGAYSFLSPKSVEGDWELTVNPETSKATSDEAQQNGKAYYSFGKPGEYGDGSYKTFFDGGVEEGSYKLSEKDGKKLINMGTEDLEYAISGSRLFGGLKMIITYPEQTDKQTGNTTSAEEYVFEQAKAPEYEKDAFDSFETDEQLTGEWITKERTLTYYVNELPYTETVNFKDNGIMTIHYESADLALNRVMYFAYSAEDGKLTFSLVTDKEKEYSVSYEFDKEGNLKFTEDNTSSSIFADEFFSDVTYKASESK